MQKRLSDKSIEEIEKQLKRYYSKSMKRVIEDFEATYDKLLATLKKDKEPTPADLYNLDKYWKMQAQLREELQKLGEKEIVLLSKKFEETWVDIYNSVALKSQTAYNTVDSSLVQEMINSVWCSDGKTWSQRVWDNTERLAQTLNDGLIDCVVTGRRATDLKNILQERFDVSYSRADTLVRTEIAHIQVQAASKRYEDFGLEYYEILGREEHEIGCDCKKMDGKKVKLSEMRIGVNAPPFHPRCRCDIMPVVGNGELVITDNKKK